MTTIVGAEFQVQVASQQEDWHNVEFFDLKRGDMFRLLGPTGLVHEDECGHSVWIAASLPYIGPDRLPYIRVY